MPERAQPEPIRKLVSDPYVVRVGRIHLAILKGYRAECAATTGRLGNPPLPVSGPFHTNHENYIQWWVRMAEPDVRALLQRTLDLLDVAVFLKRAARPLKYAGVTTYEAACGRIARFCADHSEQLAAVEGYVDWLAEGHPRRPSILWSYKPVGSTNRMLRSPPFEDMDGAHLPPAVTLEEATAYVSNAYQHGSATQDRYDEPDGARMMASEFEEYWAMFRESIETIIAECRSQERILSILESEQFWDRFAREVVLTGSPETEVWDAKETLDAWHCPSATRLSKEVQFAERAASFANCDGGALILGISDKPPRKLIGIRDTEHRATNVRDLLERLAGLDPTVARVMPVRIQADGGAPKLCLVVAIAQTSIPIRVDQGNGTWSYPVRRGSDTVASTPEAIHTRKVHGEVGAANFGFLIRLAGRLGAR